MQPRRAIIVLPAIALTIFAAHRYWLALGDGLLRPVLVGVFAILFGWLAIFGAIAIAGAIVRLSASPPPVGDEVPRARVAVLMPIYHEYAPRVLGALATMAERLIAFAPGARFDFFALSDSRDPERWLAEEEAFLHVRQGSFAGSRIFYRRRTTNTARKAGNIEDFIERWGGSYDFAIILDADSLMEPATMLELARRMERDPQLGLLQAPCRLAGSQSLLARIQQFAASLCGPALEAGLAFFCGDAGNYWGHNAIVRLDAFQHCGLPKLPGKAPFGGEILSHDFVEAGLIRRAGYSVELAWDLTGSWEECPNTWFELLTRDRRWCQGNLQHAKVVIARGLHPMTRFHLAAGILSYVLSPALLAFVALSVVQRYLGAPDGAAAIDRTVLGVTGALLVAPKIAGLAVVLASRSQRAAHGGVLRVLTSVALEILFAMLLAPVIMLAQTGMVLGIVLGGSVGWSSQARGAGRTDITGIVSRYGARSIAAILAAIAIFSFDRALGLYLSPLLLGLSLSVVTTWMAGSLALGRWTRKRGLFSVPEETRPPDLFRRVAIFTRWLEEVASGRSVLERVVDRPSFNALHRALLDAAEPHRYSPKVVAILCEKAAASGLATLTREEKLALLSDATAMRTLAERMPQESAAVH